MKSSSAATLILLLAVSATAAGAAAAAVGTPDVPVAFAATGIAGLYRSTDLFATATLVLPSFVNKVVATKDATTGNNVLYAAGGAVWKSVDNGQTWKQTVSDAASQLAMPCSDANAPSSNSSISRSVCVSSTRLPMQASSALWPVMPSVLWRQRS